MIYAAYGSNMNITQMAKRCPAAKRLGVGTIREYELIFCEVATIKPCTSKEVTVVIWDLTKDCEKQLDIYEGFPHLYIKENFKVDCDNGETVDAMVYVMAKPHCEKLVPPSKNYLQTIIDAYEQNGIWKPAFMICSDAGEYMI